jgi:uncharacterized protein (DUF736 family)
MPRDANEIGAIWRKANDRGEYFSLSLDLEALLALTGGAVGKVDIKAFPIDGAKVNPNAPDYRLKYYPKGNRPARTPQPAAAPLTDDDIPF